MGTVAFTAADLLSGERHRRSLPRGAGCFNPLRGWRPRGVALRVISRVCFVLVCVAANGAAAEGPKRVLIVHSFGSAAPPFTTHSIAFETELTQRLGERVDLDEVSLDHARHADADMEEALVAYLQK